MFLVLQCHVADNLSFIGSANIFIVVVCDSLKNLEPSFHYSILIRETIFVF